MKRLQWFLIMLMIFLLVGCSNNVLVENLPESFGDDDIQEQDFLNDETQEEETEIEYEVHFERFELLNEVEYTDILIEYPQIKGLESPETEMKVNALLKDKAMSVYETEASKGLSLQIKPQIEYSSSNLISVKYLGHEQYHDTMSINDIMYATNINLKTGKIVNIQEVFNDDFQQKLNRDIFIYNGVDKAGEGETIETNTHEYGYVNADESIISEMFDNYYSDLTSEKYYFGDDNFSIIIRVPSGPTVYLELAASYKHLKGCMNNDILFGEIF